MNMIILAGLLFTVAFWSLVVALFCAPLIWTGRVVVETVRHHWDEAELPEDWWAAFERDFRAYARSERSTGRGEDGNA